jgi:D-methionine transport system ATP-binding protein
LITISNLKKVYTARGMEVHALEDVSLHVSPGEIFGIIGLSGAGKSTLVRCINLLEKPTAGTVLVDGEDLTQLSQKELRRARQKIGMNFQHFNLLWSRTVAENVAFPLEIANVPKAAREKKVFELLSLVGLEDKANNYPAQLSGGQKQRVGIARALANDPKILLCDEATSALDPETTKSILTLLKDINKKLNLTIVLITHEMHVIKEICDSVGVLDRGIIVEQGSVLDLFTNPKTAMARNFINSIVNTEIPPVIKERQSHSLHHGEQSKVIRVSFIGETATEPLISSLVQKFGIQANILYGNIDHIKDTLFGSLTLELLPVPGGDVDDAINYLKSCNLQVEVLDRNGNLF